MNIDQRDEYLSPETEVLEIGPRSVLMVSVTIEETTEETEESW